MTALRLGVLLSLVAASLTQFTPTFNPGFAGGAFGNRYGAGFSPFGVGRSPIGFNTAPGTVPAGPASGLGPVMGYDPFYSNIQRTQIYAANFGYDQTSSAGAHCVNGFRTYNGLCHCGVGFKGADCSIPLADIALNNELGVLCVQSPGNAAAAEEELSRHAAEGELGIMKRNLQTLMATGGRAAPGDAALTGPGFGNNFCPQVPNRGPMAPVHLKSAITDYGYVTCTENQLCYNKACAPCTMFNPKTGVCDSVTNPQARGLPNCNVMAGETPYALKVQWYAAALQRPKFSAEGGAPVSNAPGVTANVGNAFFGGAIGRMPGFGGMGVGASPAPYGQPFYG